MNFKSNIYILVKNCMDQLEVHKTTKLILKFFGIESLLKCLSLLNIIILTLIWINCC